MSSMRRHYESGLAYFATTVTCERREVFKDPKMCRILLVTLEYYKTIFDYQVYGYCVMPDHLHIIIRPTERYDLSFIMKMVKGSFTRKINKLQGLKGSIWQSRFYEEAIRSNAQLMNQLGYIHENPVTSNLAPSAGEYEFSSYKQYFYPSDNAQSILEVDKPE